MLALLLGETGGVTPARRPGPGGARPDPPGLVVTDNTPVAGPGAVCLANFSGLDIPVTGGRERGEGEGRNDPPWGRAEWKRDKTAGGVKESLLGTPPDSLRSP